ncbi:MAG: NADP-dependent oxidoreductase [Proteobacteria bacterium]|nr:NADP-dependent oxidoreductase [Pseudomonadota bacterium]MBU1386868.1 NADP-dependent oxidoreductase [Pseudomonadota bacterium]MBU1541435.1 NADP-dependent oxidoreductase [Pseudomonadota bacterium]MBU2480033.1 NADP-dependent oxidoreductase [Pseudomonadota bacterium]
MSENTKQNRRIVLASRPFGKPVPENFRLEKVPVVQPEEGQVLLQTQYLSLDPYMRGRISDAKSYAEPVGLGEVIVGATVCQVVASKHPKYKEGDWVVGYSGWQDYMISNGAGLMPLGKDPQNPSYALGIMGMPGFTGYMGLMDIGQPREGETIVVAAATGPVGATVGQTGKIKGCRVVGVAGGSEKCQYAKEVLGFDDCIDHRSEDFARQLKAACPDGIDIYFESVGGKVFDAVLPLLNTKARIPLCGLISQYNLTRLPEGPDRSSALMSAFLVNRVKIQGFIVFDDYGPRYPEFAKQMSQWLAEGKIKYREHVVDGLENAPEAFIGLLEGKNFGKLVIRVNDR